MNNSERFDEEFFRASRSRPHGHYHRVATTLHRHFPGRTFLEAGCGMGWIIAQLRKDGEWAEGFDISQWAVDNAICPGIWQADLIDLAETAKKWDIALASNILAYFEREEIDAAIRNLMGLCSYRAVLIIQTLESVRYNFDILQVQEANMTDDPVKEANLRGRRTIRSYNWWRRRITGLGFEIDQELLDTLENDLLSWTGGSRKTGVRTTFVVRPHLQP